MRSKDGYFPCCNTVRCCAPKISMYLCTRSLTGARHTSGTKVIFTRRSRLQREVNQPALDILRKSHAAFELLTNSKSIRPARRRNGISDFEHIVPCFLVDCNRA